MIFVTSKKFTKNLKMAKQFTTYNKMQAGTGIYIEMYRFGNRRKKKNILPTKSKTLIL